MKHYHKQVCQEHPAKHDSNGNGEIVTAIRRFSGWLRIIKLCLEKGLQQMTPSEHKVVSWLVEHVAWVPSHWKLMSA